MLTKKQTIKLSFVRLESVGELYEQDYLQVSYVLLDNSSYSSFSKYVSTYCLTICDAYAIIITDRGVKDMIDKIEVIEHTKDERLHCGQYCDYADFYEFYYDGEMIGWLREETGEGWYRGELLYNVWRSLDCGVDLVSVDEKEMVVRSCENGEIYVLHGKSTNDCDDDFGENDLICE